MESLLKFGIWDLFCVIRDSYILNFESGILFFPMPQDLIWDLFVNVEQSTMNVEP